MPKLTWKDGVLIMENTVVGSVLMTAGGEWEAHGCMTDWQDTSLGIHEEQADAKLAVLDWVAKMQGEATD